MKGLGQGQRGIDDELKSEVIDELNKLNPQKGAFLKYCRSVYATDEEVQKASICFKGALRGTGISVKGLYNIRKLLSDDLIKRCVDDLADKGCSPKEDTEIGKWFQAVSVQVSKKSNKRDAERRRSRLKCFFTAQYIEMEEARKRVG